MKKRILVYGAGVIGSIYAGLLSKSGHNVTILARNKRLLDLKNRGLLLQRSDASICEKIPVNVVAATEPEDFYDYVFVTLRYDQVKQAMAGLSTINTACFVFMVNNPTGYSEWIDVLGYSRVLAAFPGAGGKIENSIVHYELVSGLIQPTTLGELNGKKTFRAKELGKILMQAGFHVSISRNMDAWQKTHVAMVAPMGDVIYFDGGTNYTVAKNKMAIRQMNLALKENFNFLKKAGIGIEPMKFGLILHLPLFVLNFIMRQIYTTKWAETVISNHSLNARSEMDLISNEFNKLAAAKGFELVEFRKLMQKETTACGTTAETISKNSPIKKKLQS